MKNLNKKAQERLQDLEKTIEKLKEKPVKIKSVKKKKEYISQKKNIKWNKKDFNGPIEDVVTNFLIKFPEHELPERN
jgi:hypothetical protein